jgi:hypothetical protein
MGLIMAVKGFMIQATVIPMGNNILHWKASTLIVHLN